MLLELAAKRCKHIIGTAGILRNVSFYGQKQQLLQCKNHDVDNINIMIFTL